MCEVLARPEWITNARFATGAARSINATERINAVGELLRAQPSEHWLPRLDAAQVPCAPVLRRHEVVANAQVQHNKLIEEIEQPHLGRIRQPRPAAQFSATPANIAGPAPVFGADTLQILQEIGYSIGEIDSLSRASAVLGAAVANREASQ